MLKVLNFNASQYADLTVKIHLFNYFRKRVHIQNNEMESESSVLFQNLYTEVFFPTLPNLNSKTTLVSFSMSSYHHVIYI